MFVYLFKGIYNRLALTKYYLLDIDLALYVPWLPSQVKFNKSWIIDFIQIKGKMKKVVESVRLDPGTLWLPD